MTAALAPQHVPQEQPNEPPIIATLHELVHALHDVGASDLETAIAVIDLVETGRVRLIADDPQPLSH